jgi:hypothetical protein
MSRTNKSVSPAEIQSAVMIAAEAQLGCKLNKKGGRGRVQTYLTPDGKAISLRGSRDGDLLFPPTNGGTSFKTLSDVDLVFLGTYDDLENPTAIDVYCFDSSVLIDRYNQAYTHRRIEGVTPVDDIGMGITLRKIDSEAPSRSHSGVLELGTRIASVPIIQSRTVKAELEQKKSPLTTPSPSQLNIAPVEEDTVAAALADCRARIAKLARLPLESVTVSVNITG